MNISQSIQTAQSTRPGAPASGPGRNKFKVPGSKFKVEPLPTLNFKPETLNSRSAFTLIELLTVIAIIGLLAALIVGGATYAHAAKVRSRVTTERNALETAIDRYKKAKGFYPPDGGTNDPACIQTPLFYEITGTSPSGNQNSLSFFSKFSSETLPSSQVTALFNMSGFVNVDNTEGNAQNFYDGLKNVQHLIVASTLPTSSQYTYTVMGIPASGPVTLNPATNNQSINYINPWRYNSSHPTNNPNSYDLWMDVSYGGKTYRISNWSADPQFISSP